MKSLIIIGNNRAISLAELFSLYGEKNFQSINGNAVLSSLKADEINFTRIGGSIKLTKIVAELKYLNWDQIYNESLSILTKYITDKNISTKLNFGISLYGIHKNPRDIINLGNNLKKTLRKTKNNIRFIPNKSLSLNAAQIINNKLTSDNGIELVFYKDGLELYIAQTVTVQDINKYASRDFNRPFRDSRNGMLPPKLAQTIINLAVAENSIKESVILDPFCGSGVILQEAILMGASALGSDLNPRMVQYSLNNINWLIDKFHLRMDLLISIDESNAENGKWSNFNFIATETSLGPPINHIPSPSDLKNIINKSNILLENFLKNLINQISLNTRLALAVPIWKINNEYYKLPLIDHLSDLGYNFVEFDSIDSKQLVYIRNDQFVGRQLLTLIKVK